MAFAEFSKEIDCVRPEICKENVLVIKEGRNPVIQNAISSYIPNDTTIDDQILENSEINVLTGPNNSGKTVYLKQIGLIVFMAHIGCFVPAEKVQKNFRHNFPKISQNFHKNRQKLV